MPAGADRRDLIVEALLQRQPAQNREDPAIALPQHEQTRQRLAQHGRTIETIACPGGEREEGQPQCAVGFPQPVALAAQKVGRALLCRRRRMPRRTAAPAGNVQPDIARACNRIGLSAHPQFQVVRPIRSNHGAGHQNTKPLRQACERGDLRHGERLPDIATGAGVEVMESLIRLDQTPVLVDHAAHRRQHWLAHIHWCVPRPSATKAAR
ncbi:hypothetical protein D9M73_98230 [compost metagenome]